MNEIIKQLAVQAGAYWREGYVEQPNGDSVWQDKVKVDIIDMDFGKFAELIVKEHLTLLQKEWYNLNNLPEAPNETPRDVGMRVGKKSEIVTLMEKIKQHFEVK